MIRRLPASLFLALLSAATLFAAADGAWLAKVPASDHQKTNPYQAQPDAIAAGRNIFEEHCSEMPR